MKTKGIILASLFVIFTGISTACQAQKLKVPEKVQTAFAKKFPGATQVKWGKENAKEYEAEFKLNQKPVSANFDVSGNWKETESVIESNSLPAPVISAIKKKYPSGKIILAEQTEQPGKTLYEVTVNVNGKKKSIEMNADGSAAE